MRVAFPRFMPALLLVFLVLSSCSEPVLVLWDKPGREVLESRQLTEEGFRKLFRAAGSGISFHEVQVGENIEGTVAGSNAQAVLFLPSYYNDIKKIAADDVDSAFMMVPDTWVPDGPIAAFADDKRLAVEALGFWIGGLYSRGRVSHVFFHAGGTGAANHVLADSFRKGASRAGAVLATAFAEQAGPGAAESLRDFLYFHARDEEPGMNLVVILDAWAEKEIWELLTGYKGKLASDMDLLGIFPSQIALLRPDLPGALPSLQDFLARKGGENRIIIPWHLFISDWQWLSDR